MADEPKKRGRKQVYEKKVDYDRGAPKLMTRVDPDVLEWVQGQPEGIRKYIEKVIREDRARRQGGDSNPTTGDS